MPSKFFLIFSKIIVDKQIPMCYIIFVDKTKTQNKVIQEEFNYEEV